MTDLFKYDAVAVELLAHVGRVLYLGWNGEAERREGAYLPHQGHEAIPVVDVQLAVRVVQLHQSTVRLKATR